MRRLLAAFSDVGLEKVRLTGGEPTLRHDFDAIAECLSEFANLHTKAFTTNGYQLEKKAHHWKQLGLTHLNVSIDSLCPDAFHRMTGHDKLPSLLRGVDRALEAGFKAVKINTVLIKGTPHQGIDHFIEWAHDKPIQIRFIELMQTGDNLEYFKQNHVSADTLRHTLQNNGWLSKERALSDGPAEHYHHPHYACSFGIIAPYSKDFCQGCNRLRVTATGDLRLCLFGASGTPLKHLLQSDADKAHLIRVLHEQIGYKTASHALHAGQTGLTPHLASIGG